MKVKQKGVDTNKDGAQQQTQQQTKTSQKKNGPLTETFRKKLPPSENPDLQNGGTYHHSDVIDMQVVKTKNNNNNDSFHGHKNNRPVFEQNNNNKAGVINNGYNESVLSGSPQVDTAAGTLDEFDVAFDEVSGENFNDDGRSTRRSGGSNNSTIIKVSNENEQDGDFENTIKPSPTNMKTATNNQDRKHSIVDLNQTATSIRHVQLNESSNRAGGSEDNENSYWKVENATSATNNQNNKPPFVDTQRFFRD